MSVVGVCRQTRLFSPAIHTRGVVIRNELLEERAEEGVERTRKTYGEEREEEGMCDKRDGEGGKGRKGDGGEPWGEKRRKRGVGR